MGSGQGPDRFGTLVGARHRFDDAAHKAAGSAILCNKIATAPRALLQASRTPRLTNRGTPEKCSSDRRLQNASFLTQKSHQSAQFFRKNTNFSTKTLWRNVGKIASFGRQKFTIFGPIRGLVEGSAKNTASGVTRA